MENIGEKRNRAFTLTEQLVAIAVILLLAAILIQGFMGIIQSTRRTQSISNLRSIGVAVLNYASDNQGALPPWSDVDSSSPTRLPPFWTNHLQPYVPPRVITGRTTPTKVKQDVSIVFMDPMLENGTHHGLSDYGANSRVLIGSENKHFPLTIDRIENLAQKIMFTPVAKQHSTQGYCSEWWFDPLKFKNDINTNAPKPDGRGLETVLCLFVDGRVEAISLTRLHESVDEYFYWDF